MASRYANVAPDPAREATDRIAGQQARALADGRAAASTAFERNAGKLEIRCGRRRTDKLKFRDCPGSPEAKAEEVLRRWDRASGADSQ